MSLLLWNRYKQAAFCFEELILSQPTNALYHLGYAEVSALMFLFCSNGFEEATIFCSNHWLQVPQFLFYESFLVWLQLLYTMGGLDNLRAARKYYAAAIEMSGGQNMRALFGICMVKCLSLTFSLPSYLMLWISSVICQWFLWDSWFA